MKKCWLPEEFLQCAKKSYGRGYFLSDQDDEWHKNKIEVMLKLLRENTDIYALNSAVNLIDESSNKIILKLEKIIIIPIFYIWSIYHKK